MPFSSVLGASSVIRPGVCTSTTRPSVPFEGQLIYETDTDVIAVYNGTSWIPYDTGFTSYTPTYTNFTIGNGTQEWRYMRLGKSVHVIGRTTLGSTSSVTGAIIFTLPVTRATSTNTQVLGGAFGIIQDAGTAYFSGYLYEHSTTQMRIATIRTDATYGSISDTSATVPMTWTSTDAFSVNYHYEAA